MLKLFLSPRLLFHIITRPSIKYSTNQLPNLTRELVSRYPAINEAALTDLCQNNTKLANVDIHVWNNQISILTSYGFEISEILDMLSKVPEIINISQETLIKTLNRWVTCGISSDYIKLILNSHPNFLQLNSEYLNKRIPQLQSIRKSHKSLTKLIIACPSVMIEPWNIINEKMDFLLNTMRVEEDEIFQSEALSKPLNHLKLRYLILLKCGLYETPSQYEHKRLKNIKSTFQNPHLKRIVDNKDVSFARKIAKISHEEYEVFKLFFESGELDDDIYSTSDDELVSDSDTE